MFLLAGLGNPGKEYQGTRHNIGFMAADEIYRRHCFGEFKSKFQACVSEGLISGEKVLLMKPQTFMNLSGNAVSAAVRFYKIPLNHVVVIHDDMDLKIGAVKVKIGGGAAGHNGIKNIDSQLGNEYVRIRVGVGRPLEKAQVIDWVLSSFSKTDRQTIDKVLDLIAQNMETYIKSGYQSFASVLGDKINGI